MTNMRSIFAAFAMSAFSISAGFALTVPVQQDTYSKASGKISAVTGKASTLIVGGAQTAYLQFNLSDPATVPAGVLPGNIVGANLRIYLGRVKSPGTISLFKITSLWTEDGTLTGGLPPTIAPAAFAILAGGQQSKSYLVIDVTAPVIEALTGNLDLGIAIVSDAQKLLIPSKEGSLPACELNIETNYANNPATPIATGNLGVGTAATSFPLTIRAHDFNANTSDLLALQSGTGGAAWHLGLAFGGLNFVETNVASNRLFLATGGNVGIGTGSPGAKLDVRGDIKFGSAGDLFAAASAQNLRIVEGRAGGFGTPSVLAGSGFTITRLSGSPTGAYTVVFNPAFSAIPAVVATPVSGPYVTQYFAVTSGSATVQFTTDFNFNTTNSDFSIIAIGPR